MRLGVKPERPNPADKAMEKHPAWAAPMSSSGLVPVPSSKRDVNEYAPSKAPLPSFIFPFPSRKLPSQTALAVRAGIMFLLKIRISTPILQQTSLLSGCQWETDGVHARHTPDEAIKGISSQETSSAPPISYAEVLLKYQADFRVSNQREKKQFKPRRHDS